MAAINDNNDNVVTQTRKRIYIPQVVSITWDSNVVSRLTEPIVYRNPTLGITNTIYAGCSEPEAVAFLNSLTNFVSAKFPDTMNIRFINYLLENKKDHRLIIVHSDSSRPRALGTSLLNHRNSRQPDDAPGYVFAQHIRNDLYTLYGAYVTTNGFASTWANISLPITFAQLKHAYVDICAHEIAHMLGLVSQTFLGGIDGHHIPVNNPQNLMNHGSNTSWDWRFGIHGARQFDALSISYLQFILPKPQE